MANEPSTSAALLVVDDDEDLREIVASALRHRGHAVQCAANGKEALDFLRASPTADLVILDLEMPEMDGRQFLAGRSSGLLDIPVLVLSASEKRVDLHGTEGVVAILDKPCDMTRLLVSIDAVLRSRT